MTKVMFWQRQNFWWQMTAGLVTSVQYGCYWSVSSDTCQESFRLSLFRFTKNQLPHSLIPDMTSHKHYETNKILLGLITWGILPQLWALDLPSQFQSTWQYCRNHKQDKHWQVWTWHGQSCNGPKINISVWCSWILHHCSVSISVDQHWELTSVSEWCWMRKDSPW